MGFTKVFAIAAEVELLGAGVRVTLDHEKRTLTLHDVNEDFAFDVLERLKTGSIAVLPAASVRAQTSPPPAPTRAATGANTAKKEDAAKHPPEKKAEPPAPKVEEKAEPPPPVKEPPKETPATEAPKSEPERVAEEAGGGGDLPADIIGAKRFVQVVDFVMKKHGLKPTQIDEIEKHIVALKEQVPVVKRVGDMRQKLETSLAAFAEEGHG